MNLENGLNFGTVCDGPAYLTLQVFNVGTGDLVITSVQRLMGSTGFTRAAARRARRSSSRPGEEIDFTIQFTPTTPGIAGDGDDPDHQQRPGRADRRPVGHRDWAGRRRCEVAIAGQRRLRRRSASARSSTAGSCSTTAGRARCA